LAAYPARTRDVGTAADYLLGGLSETERMSLALTTARVMARIERWAGDHRAERSTVARTQIETFHIGPAYQSLDRISALISVFGKKIVIGHGFI
jgi:hypothetical protein